MHLSNISEISISVSRFDRAKSCLSLRRSKAPWMFPRKKVDCTVSSSSEACASMAARLFGSGIRGSASLTRHTTIFFSSSLCPSNCAGNSSILADLSSFLISSLIVWFANTSRCKIPAACSRARLSSSRRRLLDSLVASKMVPANADTVPRAAIHSGILVSRLGSLAITRMKHAAPIKANVLTATYTTKRSEFLSMCSV